jgi:hypothetical protein
MYILYSPITHLHCDPRHVRPDPAAFEVSQTHRISEKVDRGMENRIRRGLESETLISPLLAGQMDP